MDLKVLPLHNQKHLNIITMKISKENLSKKSINGYTFSYFEKGFYYFQKRILPKGFNLIKFLEEDFSNGNFEFMCENELSR